MADLDRQQTGSLLSNAVKYNRPGGTVWVSALRSESPEAYVVRVADTGPGIPPDRLDRLFLPFDRLGAERTGVEGTGLGLALSKALLEAMGGRIRLEQAEGDGAAFLMELTKSEDPGSSLGAHVDPRAGTEESISGTPPRGSLLRVRGRS